MALQGAVVIQQILELKLLLSQQQMIVIIQALVQLQ